MCMASTSEYELFRLLPTFAFNVAFGGGLAWSAVAGARSSYEMSVDARAQVRIWA